MDSQSIIVTGDNGTTAIVQTVPQTQVIVDGALRGEKGAKGDNGVGIPAGGATGQFLRKQSGDDYDTVFQDATADDILDGTTNRVYTNTEKTKLAGIESGAQVNVVNSVAGKVGDVTLNKSDVGLNNIDNTSDLNKPVSTATQTALNGKEAVISPGTTGQYYRGDKTWQDLNKAAVGLGSVDNTSDLSKPISTAVQAALDTKAPLASPGFTGNPTAPTQSPNNNSTRLANTAYVDAAVSLATISDATTSSKGKLQLSGDLSGTASAPTVPKLKAIAEYTIGLTGSGADYECATTSQQIKIQEAITQAESIILASGRAVVLRFLPGIYDQISNTINLTPKYAHLLYIIGSGVDVTVLKKTASASGGSKIFGANTPTYSTTPGSDFQNYAYSGMQGFHLSDITLNGNGANQTSGSPISLAGCQYFDLKRVKIYDGYQFQSYLKGASGRQIMLSDGTTNATVTAVRGSNFISLTTGTGDFTTQVSAGDKLRVATTTTPDNTNGSDADYAFDSANVVAVTANRIQLSAPWPHSDISGRQARFFKPNYVDSANLWYENTSNYTTPFDDSWGGGAFEGRLTNIIVKNSGGYGIGMTGSGAFIVSNVTIRGGVKGIGTERCYGSTQISNFDISGCSSAGLWVVNGNYRIMFNNGIIQDCAGNGIDEKSTIVSSDAGAIKSGNLGVIFHAIEVYRSGTHGARITGDGITLWNMKFIDNAMTATGAGLALASDTNGSLTLNAPNVRLIDVEMKETRSSTDRTQDYGLWIISGAGANIETHGLRATGNITSQYKDDNGTPRIINFKWDSTNNRWSVGDIYIDAQMHNVTDPTSAQDAATKNYVDSGASIYRPGGTDVDVADGGTGSSTAAGARTNLGLGTLATLSSIDLTANVGSTILPVANGGTGQLSLVDLAITTPKITTGIKDTNGNNMLSFTPVASAVASFGFTNAIAGGTNTFTIVGGTNNNFLITGSGTGIFAMQPGSNSTNAWRVRNAAGTTTNLSVDTTNNRVAIGGTTPTDTLDVRGGITAAGNLNLGTAGNKIKIATGTNASAGTGTLSGGTATISTTAVTSSSLVFLTDTSNGANIGILSVGTITNGTSFVVHSSNALDSSTFNWFIIN